LTRRKRKQTEPTYAAVRTTLVTLPIDDKDEKKVFLQEYIDDMENEHLFHLYCEVSRERRRRERNTRRKRKKKQKMNRSVTLRPIFNVLFVKIEIIHKAINISIFCHRSNL
jgi:formylmethanofuran dehydrogenase subunit E